MLMEHSSFLQKLEMSEIFNHAWFYSRIGQRLILCKGVYVRSCLRLVPSKMYLKRSFYELFLKIKESNYFKKTSF